ncbi:hypothetical protein [Pectobacterium parmentieri]|uniref:Hypoticical protein n=1 Tax=Pectobacterium parmentieri TaxID=1905730 RepID=A0A0H3I4G8_PECPM|nr:MULTISPECIES: hypothetical protein [Pectobacterium]AFI89583.1 Hypoticical protein [Pectobacterium parmentieri]MBI0473461.1 hypothetical protein [Pectobacterium parmentieri]MBI0496086.1 hypothetical protein [Pectobacterium parmentieri]MBI0554462.1 hypothetical protein [Pectobacterium parmentieri]MBI0570626.1 hypothetical protein [Pectobacterium parmentieri]
MTIRFWTNNPQGLLNKFKELIEQDEPKGRINTWEQHSEGFRHTARDWKELGLFIPRIADDNKSLIFNMKGVKNAYAYAYYHGHLLQTFIEHLGGRFSSSTFSDSRTKK